MTQIDRIEQKLDMVLAMVSALVDALAEENGEEDNPALDLNGQTYGGVRDETQPL